MSAKPDQSRVPSSPLPVGIWVRVSTDQQAQGESPEHHKARAEHYAASKGWRVCEVYDLAGVSGKAVLDHPEAKRMLRDVERGHIKALIFSKLARLARSTATLLEIAEKFKQKGANLVSLQESLDTSTPAGMLFFTIVSAMAEWERGEIADRVRASISIRAKLGKPLSGKTPYGYVWKDQKFVQQPHEAAIRREMYALFLKERRLGAVARLLNEKGYRTRSGHKWSDTAVMRGITDWAAKGTYRINVYQRVGPWQEKVKDESEWGMVPCEPLVSEEVWNEANRILEERKRVVTRRPGPKPVHLFAGLIFCHCGQRMYVGSNTPKYVCHKCRHKIRMDALEAVFVDELKEVFTNRQRLGDRISHTEQRLSDKERQLAAHQQEIQRVRDEMSKTHRLYLAGQIALEDFSAYHKPLADRASQLQAEIPKLEAEVDFLRVRAISTGAVQAEVDTLYANWPHTPPENKRRIIEGVVEKLVIHPADIEITFSASGSSEEVMESQQNLRDRRR